MNEDKNIGTLEEMGIPDSCEHCEHFSECDLVTCRKVEEWQNSQEGKK